MNTKDAKKRVSTLLNNGDVTKKARNKFIEIVQRLDTQEFYIEPCINDEILSGWNLMKDGFHYHYLTDSLNFSQLQGVAANIDDIFQQF